MPKTLKMVLDTSLLDTQRYKVRINGVVAIEKGAFGSPSTTVTKFTLVSRVFKEIRGVDRYCQLSNGMFMTTQDSLDDVSYPCFRQRFLIDPFLS